MQRLRQDSFLLTRRKQPGVRLALDDFSTGYSNLMALANLPFDTLKIDRAFIAGLNDSTQSPPPVNMIVTLAQQLKLALVAEGIETCQQQDLLAGLGCEYVQGFLHAPPLVVSEFERLTFDENSPIQVRESAHHAARRITAA